MGIGYHRTNNRLDWYPNRHDVSRVLAASNWILFHEDDVIDHIGHQRDQHYNLLKAPLLVLLFDEITHDIIDAHEDAKENQQNF